MKAPFCVMDTDPAFIKYAEKLNVSKQELVNAVKASGKPFDPKDNKQLAFIDNFFKVGVSQPFTSKTLFRKAKKVVEDIKSKYPTFTKSLIKIVEKALDSVGFDYKIYETSKEGEYSVNIAEPKYQEKKSSKKEGIKEDINGNEKELKTPEFEKSKTLVERIKQDSKDRIKFDKDTHTYYVDGEKADLSVTQYFELNHNKAKETKAEMVSKEVWFAIAGPLGTSADTVTRDFFNGTLKSSYPNFTSSQLADLISDLKEFEKLLDKKFGGKRGTKYNIVTEEFPIAGKYTVKGRNGASKTLTMAGTMDMLIYDDKGNFYIYDMKTKRSGISAEDDVRYTQQLQFYKSFLEANYPEIRGKIKELKLIQFDVTYKAPVGAIGRNGQPIGEVIYESGEEYEIDGEGLPADQMIADGKLIQSNKWYKAPRLHIVDNNPNSALYELENESIDNISSLTPSEKTIMEDELPSKEKSDKASKPTPRDSSEDRDNSQSQNLYGNPLLNATERRFLANYVMNMTSFIITQLQTMPEANSNYFNDKFEDKDFTRMTRQEIINTIGVGTIFDYIKESYYNPDNTDIEDFDILDKLELVYNNFNALTRSAYAKLITLEGVTVVEAAPEDIKRDDVEESVSNDNDLGTLEEKDREYWQLGQRQISARSSLSGEIRRAFEKLFVLKPTGEIDATGKPVYEHVKDKYGYGFDTFVDSGEAVNSILDWVQDCTTMEEMETILQGMTDNHPWVNSILEKIKEEPFRSMFFQNFRKDFTRYSIVRVEYDKNGNRTYVTEIINTKGATASIMDNITALFKTGNMRNLIIPLKGDIDGAGRVNEKSLESLIKRRDILISTLSKSFTRKSRLKKALEDNIDEFVSLLSDLGIPINPKTLSDAFVNDTSKKQENNTVYNKILNEIGYIFDILNKHKGEEGFNPMEKGSDDNIYGNYRNIVTYLEKYIQDSIESSTYENGKMHYSFTTPSYMGKLVTNLRDSIGNPKKFKDFLQENYGSYKFFKNDDGSWNNEWLRLFETSDEAREAFQHKVQLSFDKTPYTDLSELGYTLSLIQEYFYDKHKKWAWYRLPILANKPSSEFVKFKRYSGRNYKKRMIPLFKNVFNQEVMRIKTVLERAAAGDSIQRIGSKGKLTFDLDPTKLDAKLLKRIKNKEITVQDLIANKNAFLKSGASFKFLSAFNEKLFSDSEFAQLIVDKLNGKRSDKEENRLNELFKDSFTEFIDLAVTEEIKNLDVLGAFDVEEKTVKTNKGEKKISKFKYLGDLGKTREEIESAIEEYVWNDMFATINIIELTTTDLAYYKGVEDFQKRYSQVHAPSLRLNTKAKMKDGVTLYSKDGKERTMYLKDNIVESTIIPNVAKVFDEKIAKLSGQQKEHMKMMKNLILQGFKEINVADAQGYDSPTAYRKKMAMQGKWDDVMEEAYNRIKSGNFNVNDLGVVWQPKKPFVYSQIRKNSGVDTMAELKVPVQNKNSEYMLLLADAIMRGGNQVNRLTAIFDFMEESAYTGRKHNNGKVLNEGEYNGIGIDTIQFVSAVNAGSMGVIDISQAESYDEIKQILHDAAYKHNDEHVSTNDMGELEEDPYDDQFVHTIPFEDYGIQQEVPQHLQDHEQLMGSQMRILSISDISPEARFTVYTKGGNKTGVKPQELINRYQKLIADNIRDSYDKLIKDLNLEGDRKERNRALSKILKEAILKDQRYGEDLLRACSLDSNDEFIIPLSDPVQSIRIQQLINSIIKSRINKQKVKGGPVVQTTAFGLSEDLHIRFKDKDGNLLLTSNEFDKDSKLKRKYKTFKAYVEAEQDSVAYFECYLPITSSSLEKALLKPDGSMMSIDEAIEKGIMNEEQLKAIGYRIPTEDKYSMLPIKIMGFLPKAAGEAIIMPKEITLLSGSDFDIDKMYIMLKEFKEYHTTNTSVLRKDLKIIASEAVKRGILKKNEIKQAIDVLISIIDNPNARQFLQTEFDRVAYNYYKKNISKYHTVGFRELNTEDKKNTRSLRNNEIFDIQWAVLTNNDTMSKQFNPGSFDVQKVAARKIQLLKAGKKWADIKDKNLNELDDLLDSSTNLNICLPMTQVYFHKQNMTAGKLIGIFANNNTSHAFLSMQGISLNLNGGHFTFDGIQVDDEHNNMLDKQTALDGTLISKYIAGYLAASVDAVKDPVLNFMNLNTMTAGAAMVLTRLGFDADSVGLFLTQPIIEKLTREYFKRNNEGYTSVSDIIQEFLNNMEDKGIDINTLEQDYVNTDFTKEELAEAFSNNNAEYQARVLLLFRDLAEKAQDLQTLTFLTKFNSVTNAVGPTIADTLVMRERYNKFLDKMASKHPPFSDNAANVIENNPILDAFYDTTVSDRGASRVIFEPYFPHYSSKFTQILDYFRTTTKSDLDSKLINKIVNDFMFYKLTAGPNPIVSSDPETRNRFINNFIEEFAEEASGIVDNDLIRVITTKPSNSRCPVESLELRTGGFNADTQERIRDAWTSLIQNPDTAKLGVKLFIYNMYRSGFTFSPKTFMHLASVDVKLAIANYVDTVSDPTFNDTEVNVLEFANQFRRNHSNEFKLVPRLQENNRIDIEEGEDVNGDILTISFNNDTDIYSIKLDSDRFPYAPVIMYNDKLYMNPKAIDDGVVVYTKTHQLGNPNNFLEYDANSSSDMESVILSNTGTTYEGDADAAAEKKDDTVDKPKKSSRVSKDKEANDLIIDAYKQVASDPETFSIITKVNETEGKKKAEDLMLRYMMKILKVDDTASNRDLLRKQLEKALNTPDKNGRKPCRKKTNKR